MPAWPANFPQFPILKTVREGAPVRAFLEFENDKGPPSTRTNTYAAPIPLAMTFAPFTEAQVAQFRSWVRTEVGNGALSFTIQHPVDGTIIAVKFTGGRGYAITERAREDYAIALNLMIVE